MKRNIKIWS